MTTIDYVIVISFLTVLAFAGLWISRLIKVSDDFFVAGRELTPFILCATITSTNLSMFHFVGMGGTAYQSGVSILWQNWTGDIALVLSGILVVPIMRRLRIRSIPEFLEMRYSRKLRTLIGAFWGIRLCVFLGILIYIAATAAIVITGSHDTARNYVLWMFSFCLVSILYSAIGGAWAVAIMDSVQFIIMLAGALIILPIAAHAVGGFPSLLHYMKSTGQENHLAIVPTTGEFNWLFISAIMLLGFKWSTVDQAILQRAFGARSPRISAQGMVLSAIVTTPFAFFWVLPGLAAAKLHPGLSSPDLAIPTLLATQVPLVARGLLGAVLCGLIAAQISAITADVNSVATLFTSDVYRSLRRHEPSQRQLLFVVRISSLMCGALMLGVAYLLHGNGAGAVRANLTVVGILDMPLFVITVIYGLLWRRANWQGATAGFLTGGALGIFTYFLVTQKFFDAYLEPVLRHSPGWVAGTFTSWHNALKPHEQAVRNIVPFISSLTALVVTPLVSLASGRSSHDSRSVWSAFTADGTGEDKDTFHIVPVSARGRIGLTMVFVGFVTFAIGVVSAAWGSPYAGLMAVGGMLCVFAGGLLRVYSE
jgi:SSS family solute:Na+ symporter